jgi:hypothetical protein
MRYKWFGSRGLFTGSGVVEEGRTWHRPEAYAGSGTSSLMPG